MKIYHEIHGTGFPLVLMHGAFGNTIIISDMISALAATHRVIAVDLQGHGRTPDVDRPLRPETMADDIAELLSELGIGQADIMGYSLGGAVAMQVAIRHPGVVRKLVVVSSVYKRRAWSDQTLAQMDQMGPGLGEMLKQTPFYTTHSRPQDWDTLIAKVCESVKVDYDRTNEIARMAAPTLLVFGSNDVMRAEHPREFLGLLKDGRLEIVAEATHQTVFTPAIVPVVNDFLGTT